MITLNSCNINSMLQSILTMVFFMARQKQAATFVSSVAAAIYPGNNDFGRTSECAKLKNASGKQFQAHRE